MKIKAKKNIFRFLLTVLLLNYLSGYRTYTEPKSKTEIRKNFIAKYSEKISEGKLSYLQDSNKGMFCQANDDLFKGEITMKVPKEFMICGCK